MYNNSNGSVEPGDATNTDPQTLLPEEHNPDAEATEHHDVSGEEEEASDPMREAGEPSERQTDEEQEHKTEVKVDENELDDAKSPGQADVETLEEEALEDVAPPSDDQAPQDVEMVEEKLEDEETEADASKDDIAKEELLEDCKQEVKEEEEVLEREKRQPRVRVELELCRVCMGTESLSDIFQLEGPVRVSDIIMKLCTTIRITERDHLPHKICESCLEQVRIVNDFKSRCETSDKELRKNLKRSANKSRRQSDFIVVNCPMSESDNEDEPVDDEEYKVSQSEVESEPVTSDDSFSPPTKRRRTPAKRGRKPGGAYKTPGRRGRPGRKPKHMASQQITVWSPKRGPGRPPKVPKTPTLSNIVYIEAPEDSSSSSDEEKGKRVRRRRGNNPCPKCDEVLPSQLALRQHLKTHPGDLYNCDRCTLTFKTQLALMNHIERHKKSERAQEEKRQERLRRLQEKRDMQRRSDADDKTKLTPTAGSVSADKKKRHEPSPATSGRDLFKCVAPLTSTYWSDSFSD